MPIDVIVVNLVMLGIVGLAIWKGGLAERHGAIIYGFFWIAALLVTTLTVTSSPLYMYTILLADWAIAFGFLYLAIRHSNLWIATAMIAQGLSSAAHAYRLEEEFALSESAIYAWRSAINMLSLIVILSLLFGTLYSWRKRVKAPSKKVVKNLWAPASGPRGEPPSGTSLAV